MLRGGGARGPKTHGGPSCFSPSPLVHPSLGPGFRGRTDPRAGAVEQTRGSRSRRSGVSLSAQTHADGRGEPGWSAEEPVVCSTPQTACPTLWPQRHPWWTGTRCSRPNDAERLASSENRVCASLSLPTRQRLEHTELKAQTWRTVPPSLTGMGLDLVRADECPRWRRPRGSGHASPLRALLGASVSLVPPPALYLRARVRFCSPAGPSWLERPRTPNSSLAGGDQFPLRARFFAGASFGVRVEKRPKIAQKAGNIGGAGGSGCAPAGAARIERLKITG